jgi:hypothetical protein
MHVLGTYQLIVFFALPICLCGLSHADGNGIIYKEKSVCIQLNNFKEYSILLSLAVIAKTALTQQNIFGHVSSIEAKDACI